MNGERHFLLKNIRLVEPDDMKTDGVDLHFCLQNGQSRILQVGKGLKVEKQDGLMISNMHGALACPAFFDLRSAMPRLESGGEESLETFLRSAVRGGFVRTLPRPFRYAVSDPGKCAELISKTRSATCRVLPVIPLTYTKEGEPLRTDPAMLKKAGAAALSFEHERTEPDGKMLVEMLESCHQNGLLFIAPLSERSLTGQGAGKGVYAKALKIAGEDRLSELFALSKALLLAKTKNLPVHFPLVTLKESVNMISQAKKEGVPISCATSPPYFSFNESELFFSGREARLSPPLRTEEDRAAVIEGLRDGVIDAICSDHTALSKTCIERDGMLGASGFETVFGAGITHLVLPGHLSLYRFLQLISTSPARVAGIDASIKEGNPADIVFFDPNAPMVYTHQTLVTRGFNTPFLNKSLYGRVKTVYCNGVRRDT